MADDTERLVADIDPDLKARAKADPRPIREIVESSLQREFSTGASAAVERRIDEKRQRINMLERERNERDREIAAERDELERLESRLKTFDDSEDDRLQEARDALEKTPKDPENPAIKKWASKLAMTPEELINEL